MSSVKVWLTRSTFPVGRTLLSTLHRLNQEHADIAHSAMVTFGSRQAYSITSRFALSAGFRRRGWWLNNRRVNLSLAGVHDDALPAAFVFVVIKKD